MSVEVRQGPHQLTWWWTSFWPRPWGCWTIRQSVPSPTPHARRTHTASMHPFSRPVANDRSWLQQSRFLRKSMSLGRGILRAITFATTLYFNQSSCDGPPFKGHDFDFFLLGFNAESRVTLAIWTCPSANGLLKLSCRPQREAPPVDSSISV